MFFAAALSSAAAQPPRLPPRAARAATVLFTLIAGHALAGCEPKLVVGDWCVPNDAGTPLKTDAISIPWSTGFEDGFCDFTQTAGFCFADARASYRLVTSPVHSGQFAAAFTIDSSMPAGFQTRCVRQGALPTSGYYGVWYYVPALATNAAPGTWNLLHFQGGTPSAQHGLWDVSLVNASNGALQVSVYDFLGMTPRGPMNPPAIPIGAWFHLEFYLRRAVDATGEIALYQDDQMLLDVTGIVTDDSESNFVQWYVGNIANGLKPPTSTLYVDDVSIGAAL